MTPEVIQSIGVPIICALIAAFVGFKGHSLQKGTRENRLIDQLQEELQSQKKAVTDLKSEHREAEAERNRQRQEDQARMARLEAKDRVYIPHILKLNWHIEQGLGPPAPPIPELIREFLEHPEGDK